MSHDFTMTWPSGCEENWNRDCFAESESAQAQRKERMEPVMNELTSSSSYQERKQRLSDRKQEAYRVALALYNQNPDWVTYFREILGIGGVAGVCFPTTATCSNSRSRTSTLRFS